MAGRNIAPTKTNLMGIKQELEFARLGHDLLDQKRNILIVELLNLVDQASDYETQVETVLADAYHDLEEAVLRMGRRKTISVTNAVDIDAQLTISQRQIMGVRLPVVDTKFAEHPPYYSPAGTSFWIDTSLNKFKEALHLMGHLAELKISIVRLAAEVKKTIRKVNALQKIAIPELQETAKSIQDRLEENERDMFVLMKMVKARLEAKQEQ